VPIASGIKKTGANGGHTIGSIIREKPMLHANLMALSFIEPELWVIEVYIGGIGILDVFGSCDLNLDPMTHFQAPTQDCIVR